MTKASIINKTSNRVEIKITVDLGGSLLENEVALQDTLNEAGVLAMGPMLEKLDRDGSAFIVGNQKFTAQQYQNQKYETPYGPVHVKRYLYQTSKGGKTYCPLEDRGRFVMNATPRYAKMVTSKYTNFGADALRADLLECNGRSISTNYIKALGDYVGGVALAKDDIWEYEIPKLRAPVASIVLGLDGTCMLMRKDGWREAMCGTISLYDKDGERMHSMYCGASPEYGKTKFYEKFTREIDRIKTLFPDALYLGIADGAVDNWSFLNDKTDRQLIDFYHAREYVGKAMCSIFKNKSVELDEAEDKFSSDLKHKRGGATKILRFMKESFDSVKNDIKKAQLQKSITYFENNHKMMRYWKHMSENLPIGSGVTEAACKRLIKQRLVFSGMRWSNDSAAAIISLRALKISDCRWESFWKKIDQNGLT